MEKYLRTDEYEEAVAALEMLAEMLGKVSKDLYRWKWIILALHNALQSFMVIALRGSIGLAVLPDELAQEWLKAHETGSPYPIEKLDNFLNLYKKIKSDRMLIYVHSKKFSTVGTQGRSVKKLNGLRNEFIHFTPKGWSLEVSGLPDICLDCAQIIKFLGWESGNILWYEDRLKERAEQALSIARESIQKLR